MRNFACNNMSNLVAPSASGRSAATYQAARSLYAADGGRKYLNLTERKRVMAAAQTLDARKALFVLTLVWTGARISEALALTPASFQVERGIVAFATLKRRRWVVREMPLPPDVMLSIEREFEVS